MPLRHSRGRGFSFIEILVVVAIIATILLVGIPAFATFLHRSRVDGSARQIQMALLSARMRAVKEGNTIGVVFSNDPARNANPSDTIGYASPTIFDDTNGNGEYDSGTDTVLQRLPLPSYQGIHFAIDDQDRASGDPTATVGTVSYVFNPFGSEISASSGSGKGIYVLDDSSNVLEVAVPVATSGRITTTKRVTSGGTNSYVPQPWVWY